MKLTLEKHSFRQGELHLNIKTDINREIEDILLAQSPNMAKWSRDEYIRLIKADFQARGWETPAPLRDKRGNLTSLMDFRKEKVGVKLGFQSSSAQADILRFQKAQEFPETKLDLGVYLTTTATCQQQLGKISGKAWGGPNFHTIARSLSSLNRMVSLPVCVIGLEVARNPIRTIDLDSTPPSVMKELLLVYLEWRYGKRIEKNVRVLGKQVDESFDGILRLAEKDVILALEVSRSGGTFPTRLFSDAIQPFITAVREYQTITRPESCLRFVLLGDFNPNIISSTFDNAGIAYGWSESLEIEYEVHSFEDFESYLAQKREALLQAKS